MKQTDKFKDIEYIQVLDRGKQVFFRDGKDLEGETKYALQVLLGENLGDGRFSVHIKQKGSDKTIHQNMRSIVVGSKKEISKGVDPVGLDFFTNQFKKMEDLVSTVTSKMDNQKEENFKLRLALLEEKNKDSGLDVKEILTNRHAYVCTKRKKSGVTK